MYKAGNSAHFELDGEQTLPPVHPRFKQVNGQPAITYIDFANKQIVLQDLHGSSSKRIDIGLYEHQYVQNYHMISEDSFLLAFNTTYFLGNHNKCVLLIDSSKNILDSIRVTDEQIQHFNDPREWDSLYYSDFTYFPLYYNSKEQSTFIGTSPYLELCQKPLVNRLFKPFSKCYLSSKNHASKSIELPAICNGTSTFYNADAKYTRACFTDSEIIFGFGHTSDLYRYNLKTEETSKKEIRTSFSEYHDFGKSKYKAPAFDYSMADWARVYFDPYKKQVLRLLRLPIPEAGSPLETNYPSYVLIKMNMNLEVIDEGIIPFGFGQQLLISPEGLWAYNALSSERESEIIFTQILASSNEERTEPAAIESKENDNLSGYLKKIQLEHTDKSVVLIPLDNSCGACLEKFASYLKLHPHILSKESLQLVIFSSSLEKANNYLETITTDKDALSKVYIDHKSVNKTYLKPWINPRLVQLDERGNVETDKTYDPDEMGQLLEALNRLPI